eukprot:jgi/Chlat1/467/Chrsp103S01082
MRTGPQEDQPSTVPPASCEEAPAIPALRGGSVGVDGGEGGVSGNHHQRAMVGGDHYAAGELARAMQYAEHAYPQQHLHHPHSPYYHPHASHHHHHHNPHHPHHHPLSPSLTYYPAPYMYQVVYQDSGPAHQLDKGGVNYAADVKGDAHVQSIVGHGSIPQASDAYLYAVLLYHLNVGARAGA